MGWSAWRLRWCWSRNGWAMFFGGSEVREQRNASPIDTGCTTCLSLARWDAACFANVAPSGRNSMLLSYPG